MDEAIAGTGAVLLGLPNFVVLAAGEVAGEVELLVETTEAVTGCPRCGVVAEPHGRRPLLVRDLPAAGRPVVPVWSKRLRRCREPLCRAAHVVADSHPQVAPRGVLTERAREWAMRQVGQHHETVAAVASSEWLAHRDAAPPLSSVICEKLNLAWPAERATAPTPIA